MRDANRAELVELIRDARQYTLRLFDHLQPAQWHVPYARTINPPAWELGHVGWFQERWCVRADPRRPDQPPVAPACRAWADRWYDSSVIDHRERWSSELPPPEAACEYLDTVLQATLQRLADADDTPTGLYLFKLALGHELMHAEAFSYTWQALGYRRPTQLDRPRQFEQRAPAEFAFDGGVLEQGSRPTDGFAFDNEKWAHPRRIEPFKIDARPVSNAQFLAFVDDGGYHDPRWWDHDAYAQLQREQRRMPRNWTDTAGHSARPQMRWFDALVDLPPNAPVVQISAAEAQAWCRWAGRALPSESQWEFAALHAPPDAFDWGGHVWEWTSTDFAPYPGFSADCYRDYSQPWFGDHRVVRGGSFATPGALKHPKFRNFYLPGRDDIFVGFRSCASSDRVR